MTVEAGVVRCERAVTAVWIEVHRVAEFVRLGRAGRLDAHAARAGEVVRQGLTQLGQPARVGIAGVVAALEAGAAALVDHRHLTIDPCAIHRQSREIARAREALVRELTQVPNDREIAARLAIDVETFWRWQADVEGATLVPLDRGPRVGDAQWAAEETLFDPDAVGAYFAQGAIPEPLTAIAGVLIFFLTSIGGAIGNYLTLPFRRQRNDWKQD